MEENKDNLKGTWKILKQATRQESKSSTIEKVIYKPAVPKKSTQV